MPCQTISYVDAKTPLSIYCYEEYINIIHGKQPMKQYIFLLSPFDLA
jgi:hypothetical protein